MTFFSNNDPVWEETAEFLSELIQDSTLVAAPESFVNVLPNVLAYDLLPHFTPNFFDLVVVHKGECLAIGARNLEVWERSYSAIFANPVFVIFAKDKMPEIDRKSDDFKSLVFQIQGLPADSSVADPVDEPVGDGLDYRPVIDFLKENVSEDSLVLAPKAIGKVLKNTLNEESILKSSLDTVSMAVISVSSAPDFPYQDLKNIATNYTPIYSDAFFAVFSRDANASETAISGDFANVLREAMHIEDYLVSLKRYRDMVLGTLQHNH